ncbi:hypothetical protein LEP1GSC124_5370 [Leptospira interrogans serovar Pyrogenes str. 200701872]|uniref:Uncharacterized protein n=1 Tax=Leptospira interrogans serovar Pyrogenes str. 200701872 TaxID=1193029 RepID=M6ZJB7_LEPIR|nr:hypothetical protein LEP1GSC124_5370 [Leptospira interrogans serovar Pyrogenes str. 200701872]
MDTKKFVTRGRYLRNLFLLNGMTINAGMIPKNGKKDQRCKKK